MTIQRTDAHRKMMIEQAADRVIGMQREVHDAAAAHRSDAVSQSVPASQLAVQIGYMLSALEWRRAKLRHFRDVTITEDPGFLTVGAQLMLTLKTVGELGSTVADHIDVYAGMVGATSSVNGDEQTVFSVPESITYAQIISACDYLIANVTRPESIFD